MNITNLFIIPTKTINVQVKFLRKDVKSFHLKPKIKLEGKRAFHINTIIFI